ncbi:hypothetical protein DFQ09_105272 [Winogradskyella pacifica]|uniref:Uncharacterized protein n=1 Tax=Winogradskyella pacifica TaxID=664642 RepID=A0A3D9MDT7_9FLAO|nr:hypothetical protein [Winogradskyella pacifica]REE17058.1 hypothetical protein DFQ09_105272 [Winogradskyella pacifica]
MIKRYIQILVLLLSFNLPSQELVLSFKNEDLSRRTSKDSYTLTNTKSNDLALIIVERKIIAAYLFNSEFKEVQKFETSNIKSKYNEVLGYRVGSNTYHVLYTNNNYSKFAILHLDFNSKTSYSTEIDLNLNKGEVFLDAINYHNELYVLSGDNASTLTLRQLNPNNTFGVIKTFVLEEISEDTSLISSKYAIGAFILSGYESRNITKIDPRTPSSIERASRTNKLYQDKETLYLTFDINEDATIFYTLNLEELDLKVKTYPYPKPRINDSFKKFNSFIFEKNIYQIASSKDEMAFEIKDFDGHPINNYYLNRDMTINFKNSPIIQEGATAIPFINTRKFEQTSKYLRKISAGNLGINVHFSNELFYITLGGYQEINTGGISPIVSTPAMTSGGFISFNPTFHNYNYYTATKSTFFNTILDSNFKHVKGEIKENSFDKITEYKKDKPYLTAEDIFYYNNELYFSAFNLKESEYNLIKF